jgi:hypothetical protein
MSLDKMQLTPNHPAVRAQRLTARPATVAPIWPGLPPAKPRTAVDRRIEALAVLGSMVGAALVLIGLGALVTGHIGLALALGIAGWLSLCGPLALALGRVMDIRNSRG